MSDTEKRNTAYHEAGHAIVGRVVPEHDPVYKVSIIPRGRALGVTMFLPEKDNYSISKTKMESQISSLYGGRLAEELIFGPEAVTSGASDDIRRATGLARDMITQWGFSDKLGPLAYAEVENEVFLGRSSASEQKRYSDDTVATIDDEIRELIDRNYQRSRQILTDNMDILHAMADALIKYETIDSAQIDRLMERKEPGPPADWGDDTGSGGGASPVNSSDTSDSDSKDQDHGEDDESIDGAPSLH